MKIKPSDYNRRDLFKMFGGSALLLHPLLSSREGYAGTEIKKRFLVMHTANGVIQEKFWPNGKPGDYNFDNRSLEPLAKYKTDLNIIKGIAVTRGANDAHAGGMVALLTGDVTSERSRNAEGKKDLYTGDYLAMGPSIDQMFAASIKAKLTLSSLHLSVLPVKERWTKYFTFNSQGKKIPREGNPFTVYESLFAELSGCGGPGILPSNPAMALRRKSVLDAILADLKTAMNHTGLTGDERDKIDEYMTNVRDIETRLAQAGTKNDDVCDTLKNLSTDERPSVSKENYPQIAELMQDLAVAALQMDLTRVVTLGYSVAGIGGIPSSFLKYDNKPIVNSHHTLTHGESDPNDYRQKCQVIDQFHASQFARLIGKMKAIKDGDSNLLNNSLALWATEIGDGKNHSAENVPFILAGTAGKAIKTGRYIVTSESVQHQGLLLDILGGLGIQKNQIGRSPVNPKRVL